MKNISYLVLICICLISCVNETNTKLQKLNVNLKKYHSIDIFHKNIETEKDVSEFIDSLNYFLQHYHFIRSKSAFIAERENTIGINDTFWANAVLSGNSPALNKKLILSCNQKIDTIEFDENFDLFSFKIKSNIKGLNKYEGRIYEGDNEYWFSGDFFVK